MAAHNSEIDQVPHELSLRPRVDEFSLQIASDLDPKFWIRIETPLQSPAQISDFTRGEVDVSRACRALIFAFRLLDAPRPRALLLKDAEAQAGWSGELARTYAFQQRLFLGGIRQTRARGKTDILLEFLEP